MANPPYYGAHIQYKQSFVHTYIIWLMNGRTTDHYQGFYNTCNKPVVVYDHCNRLALMFAIWIFTSQTLIYFLVNIREAAKERNIILMAVQKLKIISWQYNFLCNFNYIVIRNFSSLSLSVTDFFICRSNRFFY